MWIDVGLILNDVYKAWGELKSVLADRGVGEIVKK